MTRRMAVPVGAANLVACSTRRRPRGEMTPDLAAVVDAWPGLTEVIRASILAMVKAASTWTIARMGESVSPRGSLVHERTNTVGVSPLPSPRHHIAEAATWDQDPLPILSETVRIPTSVRCRTGCRVDQESAPARTSST